MGTVYILQSEVNGRFYIGSTGNLSRRLVEHNNGISKYTRFTRPFKLVFSQNFLTIQEARRIEIKLKRLKSRVIIERIIESKVIKLKDA